VLAYYLVVYAASYSMVGGFFAAGGSFDDPSWVLFAQLSSLTPALVAVALTRLAWREPLVRTLALRPRLDRWLLASWAAPWALSLLALGLGLALPGVRWDGTLQPAVDGALVSQAQLDTLRELAAGLSVPPYLLLVPVGLLLGVTTSFLSGCGEEIGWRGFLHGELRPLGFWGDVLVTGALWLGWHLPLLALGYGYPGHPWVGGLLLAAHCMISSVSLAYLRERTGSALGAGLFHGGTEATALLAVAPLAGGSPLSVGIGSLSWIVADLLLATGLLLHDRFATAAPIAWVGHRETG
jgi:hypothetical protein